MAQGEDNPGYLSGKHLRRRLRRARKVGRLRILEALIVNELY